MQDISCLGKCSLTVALPIISAMGSECVILPSAVLSTHTAFKEFTFRDLTSDLVPIVEHWQREKFHFDSIYTGYLGSIEQINIVKKMFASFAQEGSGVLRIVDPCMADNGSLYKGFTLDFAKQMATLCAQADVILPNLSEASFLLGRDISQINGYDKTYVEKILAELAGLGAKNVVLKGIDGGVFGEAGKIGIASLCGGKLTTYFHEKLPTSFHGTGDVFASVFTGELVRNADPLSVDSIGKGYKMAADFVVHSIKETVAHPNYNWYGVDFESVIGDIVAK